MTDGLPGDDAAKSAGGIALSGWLVAQLLLAVFLIPAVDGLHQLYEAHYPRDSAVFRWLPYVDFSGSHANVLWIVQAGLVLNVLGSSARRVSVRWAAILAAILFLLVQEGQYNYRGAIYLSLAAVAGVWLIWDPSPFGWKMWLGTAVGFLLVAAHYEIFERNATALSNTFLALHYLVVGGALLIFRAIGWKLLQLDERAAEKATTSTRFSFAHLLGWVTCCGLGLALLKFIDFAAPHTLPGRDLLQVGNQELFWGLFIYAFVGPVVCLLAIGATLSQRLCCYWLGLLTVAAVAQVGLDCLLPGPYLNPFGPGQTQASWRSLIVEYQQLMSVLTGFLLVAAAPTAILLVYRAAGFRWSRDTIAK